MTALESSERFGVVMPDAGGLNAETVLTTEIFVHVATAGGSAVADPVYGELASRIILIYTLTHSTSNRTIFKYTTEVESDWEYAPRVREDMFFDVAKAAEEMGFLLQQ